MRGKKTNRGQLIISKKGFLFPPFHADKEQSLQTSGLPEDTDLLTFEIGGNRRALVMREMTYHHVAQGLLKGEPYLISF